MTYKCPNCCEKLYLGCEYEETICVTCGYVVWTEVQYRAPKFNEYLEIMKD